MIDSKFQNFIITSNTNNPKSELKEELNYSDKTFLYENSDDMFHGHVNTYDLIGHGGTSFREEKIEYFKKYYESHRI
jgi:hypothetical protein